MFKTSKTPKIPFPEKFPLWTSLSETEQEITKGGYPLLSHPLGKRGNGGG